MGRACDPQRTQRPDLPAAEGESTEHSILPSREVRADPSQASRHLQGSDLEVGSGLKPAGELLICRVIHPAILTHRRP